MARAKRQAKNEIDNYTHPDKKRLNNPPVGLVTPDTDKDSRKTSYAYDPPAGECQFSHKARSNETPS
jgi:adenine-specific DNA-methyltransferase